MAVACIAVNWGTTSRRTVRLSAAGAVVDRVDDDPGALAVAPACYPDEIAALRARLGALPVIAAGMVDLAAGAVTAVPGVTLLPGVSLLADGRADVMRGEEVRVLGAVAAGLADADALFCQPAPTTSGSRSRTARSSSSPPR